MENLKVDLSLLQTGLAYVTLICKSEEGIALEGVHVSGFCDLDRNATTLVSSSNGNVSGYAIPKTSSSFQVISMLDISGSVTLNNVTAGNRYNQDFIITSLPNKVILNSVAGQYFSSRYKTANVWLCGGGGGGAGQANVYCPSENYEGGGGGGGGGGNVLNFSVTIEANTPYDFSIGSGGGGGTGTYVSWTANSASVNAIASIGKAGGTTIAFGRSAAGGGGGGASYTVGSSPMLLRLSGASDNGGRGGVGYYVPYASSGPTQSAGNGGDGTIAIPTLSDGTVFSGGGAGGAYISENSQGGKSHGGSKNENGKAPGGGGAGGHYAGNTGTNGRSGASGGVYIIYS